MSLASARRRYVADAIQTVQPHQLVVMLYDRLLLDITRGADAARARKYEVVNEQLTHAQDIVLELQASLDPTLWSGGTALKDLYVWLSSELVGANVTKDADRIDGCARIVRPLATAWRSAATQLSDASASTLSAGMVTSGSASGATAGRAGGSQA